MVADDIIEYPEATAQDILAIDDVPIEAVDIPEWKLRVYVCGLTGNGKDDFEASCVEIKGRKTKAILMQMRAKLLSRTLCDHKRNRLFNEAQVERLGTKSALILDRLYAVARRLSGMDEQEIETIAKNSEAGPTSDSGNGSPSPQG